MSFDMLPIEIQTEIFSHLDPKSLRESAALVCKNWLELIKSSSRLSGEISLKWDKNGLSKLKAYESRFPKIKRLAIRSDGVSSYDEIRKEDFDKFPLLKDLVLNITTVFDLGMLGLCVQNYLQPLEKMSSSFYFNEAIPLTIALYWNDHKPFTPDSGFNAIDFQGVETISVYFPKKEFVPREQMLISREVTNSIISKAKNLKNLVLVDTRRFCNSMVETIQTVMKNCPEIKSLRLITKEDPTLESTHIFRLCLALPKVEKLHFQNMAFNCYFGTTCKQAKTLILTKCRIEGLKFLPVFFPKLHELQIEGCFGLQKRVLRGRNEIQKFALERDGYVYVEENEEELEEEFEAEEEDFEEEEDLDEEEDFEEESFEEESFEEEEEENMEDEELGDGEEYCSSG